MKITNVEGFPVWGGGRNFFFVVVDTDVEFPGSAKGASPVVSLPRWALSNTSSRL